MHRRVAAVGTAFAVGVTLLVAPQAAGAVGGVPTLGVDGAPAPESTALTLAVSKRRIGPGDTFTVSTQLTTTSDDAPAAGADVQLQWQTLGLPGWRDGSMQVTGGQGRAAWELGSPESRRFRVVFAGTAELAASVSEGRSVVMKPVVRASLKRDWVRPDGSVKLKVQVRPAYDGEFVELQRRVSGKWKAVKRKRQGGQGRAEFTIGGMDSYGLQRYRVALHERDAHLGAVSKVKRLRTVRLVTYVIETRGKVKGAMPSFRKRTAEIYADPRGWSRANVHFKKVKSGGAFSLVLSQAKYVPGFAPICDRYWSCRVGRYVIINEDRWRHGTPYFKSAGGNLRQYRAMVVNHETGHWLGLGHASCGGNGQPAPVMMQQSKGLYGCKPNPWPLKWEVARAS